MKANLKNALMIVAALLVGYVGAFFGMMKVEVQSEYAVPGLKETKFRVHVQRWASSRTRFLYYGPGHWTVRFFAPLIWVEHQILPPEYWRWNDAHPKPIWPK